ncbi:hypothetical protein O9992_02775 [Vibrio lentus]|nr:hypothetical protein [Vibrio lentus]
MFAKSQGILYQGRGSAANSVFIALEITYHPRQISVLFERFISKRTMSRPILMSILSMSAEEVIQYIYKKYGRERCCACRDCHFISLKVR